MDFYKAGDSEYGDEMMEDSKKRWNYALKWCGDIATNSSQILSRFEELWHQRNWGETSQKIYKDYDVLLEKYFDGELTKWFKKDYFESGMLAG